MSSFQSTDDMSHDELDLRILHWFAAQTLHDSKPKFHEIGNDPNASVTLTDIAIDLNARVSPHGQHAEIQLLRELASTQDTRSQALAEYLEWQSTARKRHTGRWLFVGGPGSGKSTLTTLFAQLLRRPWVVAGMSRIEPQLAQSAKATIASIQAFETRLGVTSILPVIPLRISLPRLARWLARRGSELDHATVLWDFLTHVAEEDCRSSSSIDRMSVADLRAALSGRPLWWMFDGFDEVPRGAGRDEILPIIRSTEDHAAVISVTTRPQSYEGEFDDFITAAISPLPKDRARDFAQRVLNAWFANAPEDRERALARVEHSFEDETTSALFATPLHVTMATVMIATQGDLPRSRWSLFEHYFDTLFNREMLKRMDGNVGIEPDERPLIRQIHAAAGLSLQVRAETQHGTEAALDETELRDIVLALLHRQEYSREESLIKTDRIIAFSGQRLVLLLRQYDEGYAFVVRSLQEFFAADAIVSGTDAEISGRLDKIALPSHWENVLDFVASRYAHQTRGNDDLARAVTIGLCARLNSGAVGGAAAIETKAGSRLALRILGEIDRYGIPFIIDGLWRIALEVAELPIDHLALWRPGARNAEPEIHWALGEAALRNTSRLSTRERRVLQVATKAREMLNSNRLDIRAWCLLRALDPDLNPVVDEVIREFLPRSREESEAATQSGHYRVKMRLGKTLATLVLAHLDWFSPIDVIGEGPIQVAMQTVDDGPDWLKTWHADVASLLHLDKLPTLESAMHRAASQEISGIETSVWQAWDALLKFEKTPTPESLATAVELATDPRWKMGLMHGVFSWPAVIACTWSAYADTQGQLAARIRSGELGSVTDWLAAEKRWEVGPSNMDYKDALDQLAPWTKEIAIRGNAVNARDAYDSTLFAHPEIYEECSAAIIRNADGCDTIWEVFCQIAERTNLVRSRSGNAPPLVGLRLPLIQALAASRNKSIEVPFTLVNVDAGNSDWPRWLAALLSLALQRRLTQHLYHPEMTPGQLTQLQQLLTDVTKTIPVEDAHSIARLVVDILKISSVLELTRETYERLIATCSADDPAALVLQIIADPQRASIERIIQELRQHGSSWLRDAARLVFARSRSAAVAVLVHLYIANSALVDKDPDEEIYRYLSFSLVREHARPFAEPSSWNGSGFYWAFPQVYTDTAFAVRLVSIDDISNFRIFKQTPLVANRFPLPRDGEGQWILILGENGVGKTTLLRALALALTPPDDISVLLQARLPMSRDGGACRISITLNIGKFLVTIQSGERGKEHVVRERTIESPSHPWVLGYGVCRGNATIGAERIRAEGVEGELHTLFDGPPALTAGVQWLRERHRLKLREEVDALRHSREPDGRHTRIWNAVTMALCAILRLEAIDADDDHIHVIHKRFGRVRFEFLSDGYLSTAGWLIDLIARWVDKQLERHRPIPKDILSRMTGIVLIDEIDLHMHPIWQMRVIDDLRSLMPRLTFVATTHNPLTAQSARIGELYIMRRSDGDQIELIQRDVRPGSDVDQVLFEHFRVIDTFDRETRAMLEQHRLMVQRGTPSDDGPRLELEVKLRDRLGVIGELLGEQRTRALGPIVPMSEEEAVVLFDGRPLVG